MHLRRVGEYGSKRIIRIDGRHKYALHEVYGSLSKNQSVENAGVAFVKGVDEINNYFEKIKKKISNV